MGTTILGKTVIGPNVVLDGLVLYLDAANPRSYSVSGTTWYDLSNQNNDFTIADTGITSWDSRGYFSITGQSPISRTGMSLTSTCTVVYWINTDVIQSLFMRGNESSGLYLGAYRVGKKEYYGSCGTPDFYMDTVDTANIYDYIIGTGWHMLEFKDVDWSTWTTLEFNNYGSFSFAPNTFFAGMMIYDRNLTPTESTQNYNSLKSRYGL
jgi:hypothetical protein